MIAVTFLFDDSIELFTNMFKCELSELPNKLKEYGCTGLHFMENGHLEMPLYMISLDDTDIVFNKDGTQSAYNSKTGQDISNEFFKKDKKDE